VLFFLVQYITSSSIHITASVGRRVLATVHCCVMSFLRMWKLDSKTSGLHVKVKNNRVGFHCEIATRDL